MYFGCCIYVLLLLNMPEMAHDWINKSILFYSILFFIEKSNFKNFPIYVNTSEIKVDLVTR